MNVANIARRLVAGDLHYALGRFATVRRGYSTLRRFTPPPRPRNPAAMPVPFTALPATLFPGASTERALRDLRRDSIALGFDLPIREVAELRDFAEYGPIRARGSERLFRKGEVSRGRLPDGTPVVLALAPDPLDCAAVRRVCCDPLLLETVTAFLGYRPNRIVPRLFWSFVTETTDEERRRRGQTIDWHFDVHDLNFCSAQFYLTDVTAETGAHALVRGSHRGKSLRMLLGSANASDEEVFARFGRERAMVVEGPAGTGFIEDTSCYHKALPPTGRDRLMLQLWIS